MKLTLLPAAAFGRSVPVGYGRTVEVEPGDTFELLDHALLTNPTFADSGLFEPADDEALQALDQHREEQAAQPTPEEQAAAAQAELRATDPGEDPVLAAAIRSAENVSAAAIEAAKVWPDDGIPVIRDGMTEIAGGDVSVGSDVLAAEVTTGDDVVQPGSDLPDAEAAPGDQAAPAAGAAPEQQQTPAPAAAEPTPTTTGRRGRSSQEV